MFYHTFNGNYSSSRGNGIKFSFKNRTSLTWLIYINCGIFLALKIFYAFFLLTGYGKIFYPTVLEWIGVPADLEYLVYRPWTLITYMFTQFEFLHLLFNMLWLYWFGTFFLNYFCIFLPTTYFLILTKSPAYPHGRSGHLPQLWRLYLPFVLIYPNIEYIFF